MTVGTWYDTGSAWVLLRGNGVPVVAWDYKAGSEPWKGATRAQMISDWPSGTVITPLAGTGTNLDTRLATTVTGMSGVASRFVVELPAGVWHLTRFRRIPDENAGDWLYSFGFWYPEVQGLLGAGADQTFVQMDAGSTNANQLSAMAALDPATFSPLQMGFCRLDSTSASPTLLAGITFRAADQPNITSVHPTLAGTGFAMGVVTPQPSPHQGIVLYSDTTPDARISYCRFQAAGRALNSQPPFEMCNLTANKGSVRVHHCEFDGRRSADLDPAQPRRCLPIMANKMTLHQIEDSWLHHANLNRYAANDETFSGPGQYIIRRSKLEYFADTHNTDPALNGGASLGGWTNASLMGWESTPNDIVLEDLILGQWNPDGDGTMGYPLDYDITAIGSPVWNPSTGTLTAKGITTQNYWPQLAGWQTIRMHKVSTFYTRGYANTLFIYGTDKTTRLQPWVYTGTWPPTAAQMSAAGVTPSTHYLVRETS